MWPLDGQEVWGLGVDTSATYTGHINPSSGEGLYDTGIRAIFDLDNIRHDSQHMTRHEMKGKEDILGIFLWKHKDYWLDILHVLWQRK